MSSFFVHLSWKLKIAFLIACCPLYVCPTFPIFSSFTLLKCKLYLYIILWLVRSLWRIFFSFSIFFHLWPFYLKIHKIFIYVTCFRFETKSHRLLNMSGNGRSPNWYLQCTNKSSGNCRSHRTFDLCFFVETILINS